MALTELRYASILEIDTNSEEFVVIRDKVELFPGNSSTTQHAQHTRTLTIYYERSYQITGQLMMLGTSGTLKGEDCYVLAAMQTGFISLQYFRLSDGVMLQQSPGIAIMMYQNNGTSSAHSFTFLLKKI